MGVRPRDADERLEVWPPPEAVSTQGARGGADLVAQPFVLREPLDEGHDRRHVADGPSSDAQRLPGHASEGGHVTRHRRLVSVHREGVS